MPRRSPTSAGPFRGTGDLRIGSDLLDLQRRQPVRGRGVTPDAGIGPYDQISATCLDLPAACNGIPDCGCVTGPGLCLGAGDREVAYGCI